MEISWLQLELQLTLMQGNQEEKMTKESVGIQSSIGVNPVSPGPGRIILRTKSLVISLKTPKSVQVRFYNTWVCQELE